MIQVTGKPRCMFDRCRGKVTSFVDGVPVCAEHRTAAIEGAVEDAAVHDEFALKAPHQIKISVQVPKEYDDDADDEPANYCIRCAMDDDLLVSATKTHKGFHLCDHHFLAATNKPASKLTKRKADPKKLVERPDDEIDLRPRRIRLPEDE